MNIADIHCDLLAYLAVDPKRSALDPASRCSGPQLIDGGVRLQTMAIFVETNPWSVKLGMDQLAIYKKLPYEFPGHFVHYDKNNDPFNSDSKQLSILCAFENASGFCADDEPLQKGLDRLTSIIEDVKPLYVSLTWNLENRFGGGALTKIGLREDGKKLLDRLDKTKVAIDLSHASDALAYEIVDYIIGKNLEIDIMASHSNARVIANYTRNLPDDLAKEIIKRKGLIGLNLFKRLIGMREEDILHHLAHWIDLGGLNQICLGADYFCEADLPKTSMTRTMGGVPFFERFGNASTYPDLLSYIEKALRIKADGLAYSNLFSFIQKNKK